MGLARLLKSNFIDGDDNACREDVPLHSTLKWGYLGRGHNEAEGLY